MLLPATKPAAITTNPRRVARSAGALGARTAPVKESSAADANPLSAR